MFSGQSSSVTHRVFSLLVAMAEIDEYGLSDDHFWQSVAAEHRDSDRVGEHTDSGQRAIDMASGRAGEHRESHQMAEYTDLGQGTESTDNRPGTEPYRFDFGKHKGRTLDEVPVSYIDWLNGKRWFRPAAESRPDLREALYEYNSINQRGQAVSNDEAQTIAKHDQSSAPRRLGFGKFARRPLDELPTNYMAWLLNHGLHEDDPELAAILRAKLRSRRGYQLLYHLGFLVAGFILIRAFGLDEGRGRRSRPDSNRRVLAESVSISRKIYDLVFR